MKIALVVKGAIFLKNNFKKLLALVFGALLLILTFPFLITAEFLPDAEEEEINTYITIGTELGIPWQNILAMDMVMYDNKLEKVDPYDNAQYLFTLVYEETKKTKKGKTKVTKRIEADNYKEVKRFFEKYGTGENIVEKIKSIKNASKKRIYITARNVEDALDDANFSKKEKKEFYDLLESGVYEEVSYDVGYIGVTPGGDYEFVEIIGSNNWIWPTKSTRVTSGFGNRTSPCAGCTSYHPAIDIGATKPGVAGDPVWTMADGIVISTTFNSAQGNLVLVDHGSGVVSRYQHLTNYVVKTGQSIKKGQLVGYMGSTGVGTAVHLDFQIKINGQAVNPLNYFNL